MYMWTDINNVYMNGTDLFLKLYIKACNFGLKNLPNIYKYKEGSIILPKQK